MFRCQRCWRARHPRAPRLIDSEVVEGFAFAPLAIATRYRAKVLVAPAASMAAANLPFPSVVALREEGRSGYAAETVPCPRARPADRFDCEFLFLF